MSERPKDFRMNYHSHLATKLLIACVGRHPQALKYADSSVFKHEFKYSTGTYAPGMWLHDLSIGRMAFGFDIPGGSRVAFAVDTLNHNVGTGDFTWSAWIWPNSLGDNRGICANGTYAPAWYTERNGYFGCYWGGDLLSGATLTAKQWQHGVMRRTNGVLDWYIDGERCPTTHNIAAYNMANSKFWAGHVGQTAQWTGAYVADFLFHGRSLTESEIKQLADPSNALLSGLILPPRRKWWPVSGGGEAPAFKAAWARNRNILIGGGV